jgi:serine protease inhibitor
MKTRMIILSLLLPTLWSQYSCEKADPVPDGPKEIVLNKKAAEIIEADQQFAFELFREVVATGEEENLMISPLSVSYALGMTLNGAAGATLDAFYHVLHLGELTNTEVNESYKDLMSQLVVLDKKVEFSIANGIWYKEGYPVLEEFISTNQEFFDAAVEELDFSDPGAVETINHWIEQKTNDKIKDMLDYIPSDAVMYLVNAIYFNARWKYRFDPDETREGDFTLENGTSLRAGFMQVEGAFNYTRTGDYTAVELPYGDSAFSMVVLLPAAGKTVGDLVEKLDGAAWVSLLGQLAATDVRIEFPKFKYGYKSLLNDPLCYLGLGIAFSDGADFSRITPGGGICISRVIHQTFINVQEEGTEAAAATIVEMKETSTGGPVLFRADRPFLYMIRENSTSAILFMGRVGKPEYS